MKIRTLIQGLAGAALLLASAGVGQAQTPAFDPRSLRDSLSGPPTQVLVMGAMHLKNLREFQPALLGSVLDRLQGWRPKIIAIEALSGQDCDVLRRYAARYEGVADAYCPSTDDARDATGLDVVQANDQADALLKSWPDEPTAAQRRTLASLFLAGGEPTSALVQWLRLETGERKAGDGLNSALVERLNGLIVRQNENEQIGAVLAARLGLERVHPMDDHFADGTAVGYGPEVGPAVQAVWARPNPTLVEMQDQPLGTPDEVLATFRFNNQPSTQIGMARNEMGLSLAHADPAMSARPYVGWWEVRNLRMAANIRASFVNAPGSRVLVLVGSSHKAYLDAYLDAMSDVRLADALEVLR